MDDNSPVATGFTHKECEELVALLSMAIAEDGPDVTSAALVADDAEAVAVIVSRQACCLAGLPAAGEICDRFGIAFTALTQEGAVVETGAELARLSGNARAQLACERILLNFLGRLSGIATITRRYVTRFHPTPVFDTRKTTPGWRFLEKYAVRAGGGRNHRMGLDDQFLAKDNHLAIASRTEAQSAITAMVSRMREAHPELRLEVEVESEEDFRQAVEAGADIVMLDNWSAAAVREALAWLDARGPRRVEIELSGGITLERAPELAPLGADRISVGALTHGAPSCDFSLEMRL